MQPESSDGLASVGTILPEGTAAGFSGGRFPFLALVGSGLGRSALRLSRLPVKSRLGLPRDSGRRSSVGRATDS